MSQAADEQPFVPPTPAEALARLGMPMQEAMRTQRAVRRLHLEPVSHEVLLPLLELSLKAPTSSNSQDWHYVVVESPAQKARLAKLYRRLYRCSTPSSSAGRVATSGNCARWHPVSGRPRTSSSFRSS